MAYGINLRVNDAGTVPCSICSKVPTILLQINGGNYNDYIGRFLCRDHFFELKRDFMHKIKWPRVINSIKSKKKQDQVD